MNTTLDCAPAKRSGETPQAEAAIERIKAILASAPAVLFMKGTPDFPQCGFSAQVGDLQMLLQEAGAIECY